MTVEILFPEVCSLFGDSGNAAYLQQTLKNAEFIKTALTDEPYFAKNTPSMILMGPMSESIQRRVIEKLKPLKARIEELIDAGTVIFVTGNAGEVFCRSIDYVTEKIKTDALGIFDFTVKTDLFDRRNSKFIGDADGNVITGFKTGFSQTCGDNSDCFFAKAERGEGINKDSVLEGIRKNNFISTYLLGPVLPLNPLFTEYLISLTGEKAEAAFREQAVDAYEQRVGEFRNPSVKF